MIEIPPRLDSGAAVRRRDRGRTGGRVVSLTYNQNFFDSVGFTLERCWLWLLATWGSPLH